MSHTTITRCRVCRHTELEPLFSLGSQHVNAFPLPGESHGPQVPIDLVYCPRCTLVQQLHTADPKLLYQSGYWYRSGTTRSMQEALANVVQEVTHRIEVRPGDVVLDIGCFPEADVITAGYVPKDISTIEIGDTVLGSNGEFIQVRNTFRKYFNGDLVVLHIRGGSSKTIRTTPNHPILVVKGVNKPMTKEGFKKAIAAQEQSWIRADQVEQGDYCVMPDNNNEFPGEIQQLDFSKLTPCHVDDKRIYAIQTHQHGPPRPAHNQKPLPRFATLNEELGRLIGYYISEGSGAGRNIGGFGFAFHEKETEYIADVRELLFNIFGLTSVIRKRNGKAVAVTCSSALGKRIFQALVGTGAANKRLPDWVFAASKEFVFGLLDGMYRGDGTCSYRCAAYATVSKTLAYQLRFLLYKLGVNCSVVPCKPRGFGLANGKTLWVVRSYSKASLRVLSTILQKSPQDTCNRLGNNKWPDNNGRTLVRVLNVSRESFRGVVYNLETETNTYVVDNIVVHNSNDGTLLREWKKQYPSMVTVGVDPGEEFASEECRRGVDQFVNSFWSFDKYLSHSDTTLIKPKVVTALGMFYDLEDPNQFVADIAKVLHPNGICVAQLMCLRNMLRTCDVGNLCHEHLEFYTLKSLDTLFENNGLELYDLETNKVNGESYRLYIRHKRDLGVGVRSTSHSLDWARHLENGLDWRLCCKQFADRIERMRTQVRGYVHREKSSSRSTWVLGASTKGNTILQTLGLTSKEIAGASERSPAKWGRVTVGSNIPIVSEEEARKANPHNFLVLPYAFIDEIMEREKDQEWRSRGGKFVVPLPEFKVL